MSKFQNKMKQKSGDENASVEKKDGVVDASPASPAVDLLGGDTVDEATESLISISSARVDGRFIIKQKALFIPDPTQPRKTFSDEALMELMLSIESVGQLQPIVVRPLNGDGKYEIIAGERRWRAISQSDEISLIEAVIDKKTSDDELKTLVAQIAENSQREDLPILEHAESVKRVVDICQKNGKGQKFVADLLNMSTSSISKNLSILKAKPIIRELSATGEIKDLEVLYMLAKASDSVPNDTADIIDKWRCGEVSNIRAASVELGKKAKEKKDQAGETPASKSKPTRKNTLNEKKVDDCWFSFNDGVKSIFFLVDGKKVSYLLNDNLIVKLRDGLNERDAS